MAGARKTPSVKAVNENPPIRLERNRCTAGRVTREDKVGGSDGGQRVSSTRRVGVGDSRCCQSGGDLGVGAAGMRVDGAATGSADSAGDGIGGFSGGTGPGGDHRRNFSMDAESVAAVDECAGSGGEKLLKSRGHLTNIALKRTPAGLKAANILILQHG